MNVRVWDERWEHNLITNTFSMLKINKWRKEMGRKHLKMLIVVICRCGNCGLFIVRFLYIFILFLCCLNFLQLTYFNFYNHKNVVIKTWLRIPKDFSMIKVTKWVLIVYWLIFKKGMKIVCRGEIVLCGSWEFLKWLRALCRCDQSEPGSQQAFTENVLCMT